MKVYKLVLGILKTNCYIVCNEKLCVIIDPAINANKIIEFIDNKNFKVEGILLTHGHFDHVSAVKDLQKQGIKVYQSFFDSSVIQRKPDNYCINKKKLFKTDCFVKNNDILNLANLKIKVIETPGHTKGSVSYLIENSLFCGDLLFAGGSIGRYDLYSGDLSDLQKSIKEKIFILDEETIVYPGHGEKTTIKNEKELLKYL